MICCTSERNRSACIWSLRSEISNRKAFRPTGSGNPTVWSARNKCNSLFSPECCIMNIYPRVFKEVNNTLPNFPRRLCLIWENSAGGALVKPPEPLWFAAAGTSCSAGASSSRKSCSCCSLGTKESKPQKQHGSFWNFCVWFLRFFSRPEPNPYDVYL